MTELQHLGTDLRLLADTDSQHGRGRGSDLQTVVGAGGATDLATVTGAENLSQALLLRLLTPLGELAALGHPDYGSRLYELVGELNTETTRIRAKVFVLQALAGEPRIARIASVRVTAEARTALRIDVQLEVAASGLPLNLVFSLPLEGGAFE